MWLIIAALLTCVLILGYLMDHSPMGHEDETGFHYDEPGGERVAQNHRHA